MWLFKTKQKPIWERRERKYLGHKNVPCNGGCGVELDTFDIWAVTYKDLISGREKIEEEWSLA